MDNLGIADSILILENAKNEISISLKSMPDLLARTSNVLKTLISGLKFSTSALTESNDSSSLPSQPLTHFLGREITKPVYRPIADKEAIPTEVSYLRANAERLMAALDGLKNSDILRDEADMTIRAVAKFMGMDVSPTNPEKLDNGFIEAIRAAKIAKIEFDTEYAKVIAGTPAVVSGSAPETPIVESKADIVVNNLLKIAKSTK